MSTGDEEHIEMINALSSTSFGDNANRVRAREAVRALLARLETLQDTLVRLIWADVSKQSTLAEKAS